MLLRLRRSYQSTGGAAAQVINRRNWTDIEAQLNAKMPELDSSHSNLRAELHGALAKALLHLGRPPDKVIAAADVRTSFDVDEHICALQLCCPHACISVRATRTQVALPCDSGQGTGVQSVCAVVIEVFGSAPNLPCLQAALQHQYSEDLVVIKADALVKHERWEAAVQLLQQTMQQHGRSNKLQKAMQDAQTALRRSKIKDYYKVLGVERDVDDKTLKRVYRKLALQYHPDKVDKAGGDAEAAEKKFAEITEAYEVLSDPDKRELHDQGRDPNDPNAGFGSSGGGGSGPFGGGAGFHFGGQRFNVRFG